MNDHSRGSNDTGGLLPTHGFAPGRRHSAKSPDGGARRTKADTGDPRHQRALLNRILIGSAIFLALMLLGVFFSRATGVLPVVGF